MAATKKPASRFEPDALYRVEVSEVCRVGALIVRPMGGATLLGSACEAIADKIVRAEPFVAPDAG